MSYPHAVSAEVVVAIVAGVALVLSQLPTALATRTARTDIDRDIELYKTLPEGVDASENLLKDISNRIQARIDSRSSTRYWFGIWLAIILMISAVAFAYWFVVTADWWRILYFIGAIVLGIVAVSGLVMYAPKRRRGPDGQRIYDGQPDGK